MSARAALDRLADALVEDILATSDEDILSEVREDGEDPAGGHGFHGERVLRVVPVGKHRAGRLLDGREWTEFPEVGR